MLIREPAVASSGPRAKVPTLLVTGHSGFVGRMLFDNAAEIATPAGWRLVGLPEGTDIRDLALAEAIRDAGPDAVLHLAASTSVDDSFRDPESCFGVNFNGTLNLLQGLRAIGFGGRLVYVSSGDCYGGVPDARLPIDERTPLRPRNPYAVSKVAAEALCYQWSQTEDMDVVIARPFNHIGPGQDRRFAVASFCAQVAGIAEGKDAPVIRTGNLDVTRDFTDVRDVLRAYVMLLESGVRGEAYNVASGREVSLHDLLQRALSIARVHATVEIDPTRKRAAEQRRVVADITRIRRDTGWEPRIPLDKTLEDTLRYWRRRVHE